MRRLSRREFIALAGGTLAGAAAGAATVRLLQPQAIPSASENVRGDAIRNLARLDPIAKERLATLGTLRHNPLPFPHCYDCVPGFSADTLKVHYEHEYLEYIYRWESGERRILRFAEQVAAAKPEEKAALLDRLEAACEATTLAGTMAVLHSGYWKHFSLTAVQTAPQVETAMGTLRVRLREGAWPPWIMVTQLPRDVARVKELDIDRLCFAPGEVIHCAIDLPEHAWAGDFPDVEAYLAWVLRGLDQETWGKWESALAVASLPSPLDAPGEPLADAEAFFQEITGHLPADEQPDPALVVEGIKELLRARRCAMTVGTVATYGTREFMVTLKPGRLCYPTTGEVEFLTV